jgi:hypothetical protein
MPSSSGSHNTKARQTYPVEVTDQVGTLVEAGIERIPMSSSRLVSCRPLVCQSIHRSTVRG